MKNRRNIYDSLRLKLEKVGFQFETEQKPHLQNRKESELKFIHPQLVKKLEEDGYKVRANKFYIKPLTDESDCEIGFVTGKSSPLYKETFFVNPNSSDSFDNAQAWTNRDDINALNCAVHWLEEAYADLDKYEIAYIEPRNKINDNKRIYQDNKFNSPDFEDGEGFCGIGGSTKDKCIDGISTVLSKNSSNSLSTITVCKEATIIYGGTDVTACTGLSNNIALTFENNEVSFTTKTGERSITAKYTGAATTATGTVVAYKSDDGSHSGDITIPTNGENYSIPKPLKYVIKIVDGTTSKQKVFSQDIIDVVRQQYMDMNVIIDKMAFIPGRNELEDKSSFVAQANFVFKDYADYPANTDFKDIFLNKGNATVAQKVRTKYGDELIVNSAWRNPVRNTRIGGEDKSYHLRGMAVDLKATGNTATKMQKLWEAAVDQRRSEIV